jgi:hypothetical protein
MLDTPCKRCLITQCTFAVRKGPLLNDSFNSKVSRPGDHLQKLARLRLLDLSDIRILMCCIRLMEVCEQGKQKHCFESVFLSLSAENNLR